MDGGHPEGGRLRFLLAPLKLTLTQEMPTQRPVDAHPDEAKLAEMAAFASADAQNRAGRTPLVVLAEILTSIAQLHSPESADPFEDLYQGEYAAIKAKPSNPGLAVVELERRRQAIINEPSSARKKKLAAGFGEAAFRAALAYCALAEDAISARQWHLAWTYLLDAQAHRATMMTLAWVSRFGPKLASFVGEAGADRRHEENRKSKADAFAWLAIHRSECESLGDAALKLTKVVPFKQTTIRDWLIGYDLKTGLHRSSATT